MREYPKTENLFKRDPETHKLIDGALRNEAIAQVSGWLVTEKVDGTNIRVLLRLAGMTPDSGVGEPVRLLQVEVRGRSDKANVPGDLRDSILSQIQERWEQVFNFVEQVTGDNDQIQVCLYGEGYGAGIQKVGKGYRKDKGLRLFDVRTTVLGEDGEPSSRGWWRDWATVEHAAEATGFRTAPVLLRGAPLDVVVEFVRDLRDGRKHFDGGGHLSFTAAQDGGDPELVPEGVVARTDPYLFDYAGERIMFKLKGHDLT